MFSIGVILFIIVQGIFPFKEARKEEYFYSLLLKGEIDTYFQKTNGTGLSEEFKNLIIGLFSYDPETRLTLEQVKEHPWMQSESFNYEATRAQMLSTLSQKQAAKASAEPLTKPTKVRRTAPMV